MVKFIIPWANLLFHGHNYYSMCNLLYNSIVIIACANLCFIFMRKISLRLITATYTQVLTYNTFCICLALRFQLAVVWLLTTRQCGVGKNAAGGVTLGQALWEQPVRGADLRQDTWWYYCDGVLFEIFRTGWDWAEAVNIDRVQVLTSNYCWQVF